MNIELAKQLKDAGFPKGSVYWYGEPNELGLKPELAEAPNPTLSELIEACGDKFGELKKSNKFNDWCAVQDEDYEASDWIRGQSPEEAVAKLWLALNSKK